jgi:predicted esterase
MAEKVWIWTALLSIFVPTAQGQIFKKVSTTHGVQYEAAAFGGRASLILQTHQKRIYLTQAAIAGTEDLASLEPPPVYQLNTNRIASPGKGVIDLVVKAPRWGPINAKGERTLSFVDPRLGPIRQVMVVSRLTPSTATLSGTEYQHHLTYPLSSFGQVAVNLVLQQIDPKDAASQLKAARFFRLAGLYEQARTLLQRVKDQDAGQAAAKERIALEADIYDATLRKIQDHQLTGRLGRALELAGGLDPLPDRLAGARPDLAERSRRILPPLETLREVTGRINDRLKGAGHEKVSPAQARRMNQILQQSGAGISDENLPLLGLLWASGFAQGPLSDEALTEAKDLAQQVEAFFAAKEDIPATGAGEALTSSRLPMAVKLSIFRHARRYSAQQAPTQWQRVEYKHPRSGKDFHYYIQVPRDYDPSRPWPVVLMLHGMHAKAEKMAGFWAAQAQQFGLVLIAPEYIYDRPHGYRYSVEEHEAVFGALRDATRSVNLDRNRVYLVGHSQGGHATWDMGAAHAGQLAGAAPLIGACFSHDYLPNYRNTGLYAIDGDQDGRAPQFNRSALGKLGHLGYQAVYVEYRDRGHEAFFEEYDDLCRFLLSLRRDPGPERIDLVALRPCDVNYRWLRLVSARHSLPHASPRGGKSIKALAQLGDNTILIRAPQVTGVEIYLSDEMVDWNRDLRASLNGRIFHAARPEIDWVWALQHARDTGDRDSAYLCRIRSR